MEPVNSEPQSPAKVGSWALTVPSPCRTQTAVSKGLGLGTYQARHQLLGNYSAQPCNRPGSPACAPADRRGKVERPPGPQRAPRAERASPKPLERPPLTACLGLAPPSLLAAGEAVWGNGKTCVGGVSLAKGVAKQFAARSVPRAAATASAPWSLQGKGEGEEVTEFTSPPPPLPE